MNSKRHTLTFSNTAWRNLQEAADRVGLSRSRVVECLLLFTELDYHPSTGDAWKDLLVSYPNGLPKGGGR
jgi:prophage tail gpP-like protein